MLKWIFPQPNDSFIGWLGRLFLICTITFIALGSLGLWLNNYFLDDTVETDYEWIGLDPSRPVSDISHRNWKTGEVFYRDLGPCEIKTKPAQHTTPIITVDGKIVSIEELFMDYQLEYDYEYLYEMFRD